jgi:large subunit ribosomal protein L5
LAENHETEPTPTEPTEYSTRPETPQGQPVAEPTDPGQPPQGPASEAAPPAQGSPRSARAASDGSRGASAERDAPKRDGRQNVNTPAEKSRLHQRYLRDVVPALSRDFNYSNPMQVPRLAKVTINVGVGEAIANNKALDATVRDVSLITGQKPVIKKARKSIAQFKLREGQQVGVMVTLRGQRMWEFLDRLMNAALPRTRDFHGVPARSFDGRGNYTLGLREQLIFPEINYDQVDKARGLEVSIVTTARTDQEARRLLELLGMPFQREGDTAGPAAAATRGRR